MAMELGLSGRTAVITGGSKGIGRAIARGLAREGVNLVLIARNADALEQTAENIRKESGVTVVAAKAEEAPADAAAAATAEPEVIKKGKGDEEKAEGKDAAKDKK